MSEKFMVTRGFLETVKSHLDKFPVDYSPNSPWQLSGEINSILSLSKSAQQCVHPTAAGGSTGDNDSESGGG